MNAEETWNRYCAKLEELRRQQDDTRKRRKESPAVEIVNKRLSFGTVVAIPDEAIPGAIVGKDDVGG